jgi:uncharacterized protein
MPLTGSGGRLLVFARAPQPGHAKTRLIPLLGASGAATLHARLVRHTLATASRAAVAGMELHGTPAEDEFLSACAVRYGAALFAQADGDLGLRMQHALGRALETTSWAIVIGTDCPALTTSHLQEAARALQEGSGAVFAPTEDGGYALLGVRHAHPRLFERITWSSSTVMQETRARFAELEWKWTELETLWDVDRPEDVQRLSLSGLLEPAR